MVSKDSPQKPKSEVRYRTARAAFRMRPDLFEALEFLAGTERRTVSQYLEMVVLEHVRGRLRNGFDDDGNRTDKGELVLRGKPATWFPPQGR
jgi:hypothetical protein